MTTEIATRQHSDTLDLLSTRLNEMMRGCQVLSDSGMLPPKYKDKPAAILAITLRGRELGMGALESVAAIHFFEGKTVLDASAQLARAIQNGVTPEWHTSDDKTASVTLHRGGKSYRSTWTWAMATRAGLVGKDNWRKHPEAMLRARAVTAGIRAFCPDALGSGGAVYSQDEAEDIVVEQRAERPR